LLYAGDGVSDLSGASEADILFAKSGMGKSALRYVLAIYEFLRDPK
jgi:2-hydroxy-3-keto-5-methylthiopentenyl-1-phosphate phosphatase